jgi:drug/metabolite transporter (DMT)-like permease
MGDRSKHGIGYVLAAAALWGFFPFFTRSLYALGADALSVAAMRAFLAALVFLPRMILRGDFRGFKPSSIPFYAIFGAVAVAGTYSFYALSLSLLPTGEAAALLYTAPAFVILGGRILSREPVTRVKVLALLAVFAGSLLVVKAYDPGALRFDAAGVAFGLLSGLCYASLTLFGRHGLKRHGADLNASLPAVFGALVFLFVRPPGSIPVPDLATAALFAGIALFGSVLPYLLYMKGLERGVDGGTASIAANVEPAIAALVGAAIFADRLAPLQILGILVTLTGASLPFLMRKETNAPV